MRLFRNPKSSLYLIAAFVIVLLVLFARHSRASELQLEGGAAVLRGYTPALGLSIQWPDKGPVGTDYELGFVLIGDGTYNDVEFSNQVAWYGMLWDGYRAVELGIGAAYFNVESPFTCQFTFALGARWRITERLSTQWRHFSTGGSCDPNSGRDVASLSFRFSQQGKTPMSEASDEVRLWERKAVAVLSGILSAAFLAWAGVVWNSADKVLMRIDRMSDQLAADRVEQQLYRAQVERRLSIVEERQNRVISVLDKLERVSNEGPQ